MKIKTAKFIKGIKGTDEILEDGIPQIAFIGRSNVGKSSVISSIINLPSLPGLVRVGKKPGKTTEINFFLVNNQYYLVDLPGYGYARMGPEEKEKIRKLIYWYLTNPGARPKVVVLVIDAKAGFTDFDQDTIGLLRENGHEYIVVANKMDKLNQKEAFHQLAKIKELSLEGEVVPYSAVGKPDIDMLSKRIFG